MHQRQCIQQLHVKTVEKGPHFEHYLCNLYSPFNEHKFKFKGNEYLSHPSETSNLHILSCFSYITIFHNASEHKYYILKINQ